MYFEICISLKADFINISITRLILIIQHFRLYYNRKLSFFPCVGVRIHVVTLCVCSFNVHVQCACNNTCTYMWRPTVDIKNLSWLLFHLIPWGRASQPNLELTSMTSLTCQLALGIWSPPSKSGITGGSIYVAYTRTAFMWVLNYSLLACVDSTLTTEPSPQPACFFLQSWWLSPRPWAS